MYMYMYIYIYVCMYEKKKGVAMPQSFCMYVYIYMYTYIHTYIHTYIYKSCFEQQDILDLDFG